MKKCFYGGIFFFANFILLKKVDGFLENKYLSPDFVRPFACKMGACRTACCTGWPVSIPLADYFKIMGCSCSDKLRADLDVGIKVCLEPTVEEYARIAHTYTGDCRLRLSDGRCAVHAELGDGVLPGVCRLYPRGVRYQPGIECGFANSCEGVIELLLESDTPLTFSPKELDVAPPPEFERGYTPCDGKREYKIRLWLIKQMQHRHLSLSQRFMLLYGSLQGLQQALAEGVAAIDNLTDQVELAAPESPAVDAHHLRYGMEIMEKLLSVIDERSDSVRPYGEAALAYFGTGEDAFDRYLAAKERFEKLFPSWKIWYEQMLVNHMFFEQFPFNNHRGNLSHSFSALAALYGLLRCLSLGYMADKDDVVSFIDMCAAVFRLVEHTSFDAYAAKTLADMGCTTREKMFSFIIL